MKEQGIRDAAAAHNRMLMHTSAALWGAADCDAFLKLYAPDIHHEDVAIGNVCHRQAELGDLSRSIAQGFPDFKLVLVAAVADAEHGGAEWIQTGTHLGDFPGMPATGRAMKIRGASIFRFGGGRIVYQADYWSLSQMMEQLGIKYQR